MEQQKVNVVERKKYYNTTDLAVILDTCPDDIAIMAKKKKIPGIKKGKRWYFTHQHLERILQFYGKEVTAKAQENVDVLFPYLKAGDSFSV